MKIAVLSLNPKLYSTRRLVEAGEARGHETEVIHYLRCYMNITARRSMVMYQGRPLNDFDAIIPRIGASRTFYGSAVVRQFELMGVATVAESQAITRSRDKLRSLQILASAGIDLPVTSFAHHTDSIDELIGIVGGLPLVVKLLEGTQGLGVILAKERKIARSVIETFRKLNVNILVQHFVQESQGEDVRAFIVGGKVVAAMHRKGPPGEFRSNLHRGGTARPVELSEAEEQMALDAADILGLHVAGVDMLQSSRGPLIMEVNSSPGLEGIEGATEIDIAGSIIELAERAVSSSGDIAGKSSYDDI